MGKILFMIVDGQVQICTNEGMDHREWYNSLGLNPDNFDRIVRGFILDNRIIYYKGSNFMYDQEVIQAAKMYTPYIRHSFPDLVLEAYCGINFFSPTEWEPIMKIQENEITGIHSTPEEKPKEAVEAGPILELKNDYMDGKFVKKAILVTGVVFIISLITKIILLKRGDILNLHNFMDILLIAGQFFALGATIYGYCTKKEYAKYTGVLASILLIFTFYFIDVLLGIFYFIFCVDYRIYIALIEFIKKTYQKIKDKKKS